MSKSFIEVEYRVVAYTVTETLWLRYLLLELGLVVSEPIKVLCNNISATYIAANPVLHGVVSTSKLIITFFAIVSHMVTSSFDVFLLSSNFLTSSLNHWL